MERVDTGLILDQHIHPDKGENRKEGVKMNKREELEKWSKVHENVVEIEEFLDHICNNGYAIHQFYERESEFDKTLPQILQPVIQHERRKLIEQFFEIDAVKLEQERRKLLSIAIIEKEVPSTIAGGDS